MQKLVKFLPAILAVLLLLAIYTGCGEVTPQKVPTSPSRPIVPVVTPLVTNSSIIPSASEQARVSPEDVTNAVTSTITTISDIVVDGTTRPPATASVITPKPESSYNCLAPGGEPVLVGFLKLKCEIAFQAGDIQKVSISADGKLIATATNDYRVQLWQSGPDGLPVLSKIIALDNAVKTDALKLIFDDGNQNLLIADRNLGGGIRSWELGKSQESYRIGLQEALWFMTAFASTPDGTYTAAGDIYGEVLLVNMDSRLYQKTVLVSGSEDARKKQSPEYTITSLAFSRNGKLLASASLDGQVRVWEVPEGNKSLFNLQLSGISLNALTFSPDGKTLAGGGPAGSIYLWGIPGGKQIKILKNSASQVTFVKFLPGGKILASVDDSGLLSLWDWANGKEVKSASLTKSTRVVDVALSDDGHTLVTVDSNSKLKFWELVN
ncbi:MAG TPA: hypothetical protein VH186_26340 [Chloroflexia bacterium]|nr:hypothetical protein [Chloroflexia bacterium]